MSYIGKNPEADSIKLKGSATEPSGTSVDGQVYFNTGTGSISKGMKVYKNSQFVAIDKQLGDADTMQLLKAADIPAIDFSLSLTSTTVGGHGAVPFESSTGDFDGTAAFTNSSSGDALLTDDSDDLVFHYTTQATNNAKNDFWGIPLTVPRAFRGGNLVLEMKYRTEIATGTMDNGYFNIAVLDRSASLQLTMSSTIGTTAIAAGSAVALAGKTYSNPVTGTTLTIAVGDRVFVESGAGTASAANTGDIVDCYVTSVSSTANEITLSKDITPCNLGRITSGWLTGVEAINAFASDTNKDGTSKKIAFKTDADTQQVSLWFLVKGTSTVKHELFFDNVLLSGNKFLQASSQTKSADYNIAQLTSAMSDIQGGIAWNLSTATIADGAGFSDLIQVSTGGTGTGIYTKWEALVDCVVDAEVTLVDGGTSCAAAVVKGAVGNQPLVMGSGPVGNSHKVAAGCSLVLKKGEEFHFELRTSNEGLDPGDPGAMYSGTTACYAQIVATPEVSDVLVLESQDEIFTDWQEYTPTWLNSPTITTQTAWWRRNGPNMEIKGRMTLGSVPAATMALSLPSGYSIDISRLGGQGDDDVYFQSRCLRVENTVKYNDSSSNSSGLFFDRSQATKATNLFVGVNYNGTSGDCIDSVDYNNFGGTGNGIEFYATNIPISGWNANFNPLLSMPLVKRGNDYEYCQFDAGGDEASSNTAIPYFTTETVSTIDQMGTVVNSSTLGWSFTASKRVFVDMTYSVWEGGDTNIFCGISINATGTMLTTSAEGVNNTNPEVIVAYSQNFRGTSGSLPCTVSASGILLEPGDIIRPHGYAQGESNGNAKLHMSVREDVGNTNMAHIIKPAVAVLTDEKGGTVNGGDTVSTGWTARELNTIRGESWFVTLTGTGTTGIGGTNKDFTLEPGTYEIEAFAPFYSTHYSQHRLYDKTNSEIVIVGTNNQGSTSTGFVNGPVSGVFTITSSTEYNLQYRVSTAVSNYGLGEDSTFSATGDKSVYANVKIRKLK